MYLSLPFDLVLRVICISGIRDSTVFVNNLFDAPDNFNLANVELYEMNSALSGS
jgi:hypothetical protein